MSVYLCVQGFLLSDDLFGKLAFSSFLIPSSGYLLKKGLDLVQLVSAWVVHLLNKIMFMLGYNRSAVLAVEYSQEIIRFLFMRV